MKSDLYASVDIDSCRANSHKLQPIWSDKHPLKMSLMCVTCSDRLHQTAIAAYGVEAGSFGQWRRWKIEEEATK